jgi:hypothetical protein
MKKMRSPLYVTTLIAGAFFMENLDGTIIATALPQMARSFNIGAHDAAEVDDAARRALLEQGQTDSNSSCVVSMV